MLDWLKHLGLLCIAMVVINAIKAEVNKSLERRYGKQWHETRYGRLWVTGSRWAMASVAFFILLPPIPFRVFTVCLLLGILWGASTRVLANALAAVDRISKAMDGLWGRIPTIPFWAWFGALGFVISYHSTRSSGQDEALVVYYLTVPVVGIVTVVAASRKTPGMHLDGILKFLLLPPIVMLVKAVFGVDRFVEPPGIWSGLIIGGVASSYAVLWLNRRHT